MWVSRSRTQTNNVLDQNQNQNQNSNFSLHRNSEFQIEGLKAEKRLEGTRTHRRLLGSTEPVPVGPTARVLQQNFSSLIQNLDLVELRVIRRWGDVQEPPWVRTRDLSQNQSCVRTRDLPQDPSSSLCFRGPETRGDSDLIRRLLDSWSKQTLIKRIRNSRTLRVSAHKTFRSKRVKQNFIELDLSSYLLQNY